jgi:hypothetical protein
MPIYIADSILAKNYGEIIERHGKKRLKGVLWK